jgi:D,D-heptose 1,7-bisphosphate phosphatase
MTGTSARRKTPASSDNPVKAVILDRDNTLLDDPGYLADPEGIDFFPDVIESLRRLREAGYLLVVVTNQSGIGRGYFDEETGLEINIRMAELLRDEGVDLAGIYYCRHHPDAGCRCRKPGILMTERAIRDHNIDGESSWVVGDTVKDILMGIEAGFRPVILMTGKSPVEEAPEGVPVKMNMTEAVDFILASCPM